MTTLPGVQRVLVPVDFGDASAAAVALAGDVAKAFGAHLTVLHAETLEMPPYFTSAQIDALGEERNPTVVTPGADAPDSDRRTS